VCSEQKANALAASFVLSPIGEKLDWRLSATMCPCHVTVNFKSSFAFGSSVVFLGLYIVQVDKTGFFLFGQYVKCGLLMFFVAF